VDLDAQGRQVDTIWFRIYNETDGAWVHGSNVTWSTSTVQFLGLSGVYTLYAWANDTAGTTVAANVTFTIIHEVTITGDITFASGQIIRQHDRWTLRNGALSSAGGGFEVHGTLTMENVVWAFFPQIGDHSIIEGTNVTYTFGARF
jgi:hypothetical protein